MNILFLDIDGVLNCQIFYEKRGFPQDIASYEQENICRERVSWLAQTCKRKDICVVISSSWRIGNTLEYFQDLFPELSVIGKTPILDFQPINGKEYDRPSVPRGCEIQYWLNKTPIKWTNYVILDDDADMLYHQASHFFQTDPYAGLTPFHCARIEDFLS